MFDKTKILNMLDPYIAFGRAYILSLRDVRNVGLLVFTVIVLLISWSGVKSIQTNYGLQKQISRLTQQNQVSSLENSNLALQNNYLKSAQYLEITARQNLGISAPGETEVLVPNDVALKHTVNPPGASAVESDVPKQSAWQQNFQAWIDFFLHRNTNN